MRVSIVAAGVALSVSACATSTTSQTSEEVYDPLEGWNRQVYAFNDGLDRVVLEPAAKGYRAITVEPIRQGVTNFLRNLNQPIVFVNTVLQGKPEPALDTVARFLLNTTVGIAGIFDPASALDVPRHNEDFGQTLGVWGVPSGAYLVLPGLGPSNVRDTAGFAVDTVFDPLNWAQFEGDDEFQVTQFVVGAVSARERLDDVVQAVREQPEPYVFVKRNYDRQRDADIADGAEEEDPFANLPDFDDFDFGDEE
ncbi:MAG: VacJ family lipoprotein [Pseudomonadota bacterium]